MVQMKYFETFVEMVGKFVKTHIPGTLSYDRIYRENTKQKSLLT